LTWRNGRWSFTGHPGPLQLYGAELLAAHPDRKVLVVEGEKCANRARPILKQSVIVTWAGGAGAARKTDWTTLRNREVTIWPDADEPGRKAAADIAAILEPVARRVRVLHTNGKADGWDVADAIAEGWNAETILTWVDEHVIEPAAPRVEVLPPADPESDYPAGSAPQSYLAIWQSLGLMSDAKDIPHPTLSNASIILQYQPPYKGKIWFDTFRSAVWHSVAGAPRPWTDADDRRATTFIQQRLGLPKIHSGIVQEAVLHAAECQPRNTLTEWLDSLVWDGIPRLTTWLADCLGVERDAYHDAVARNWPISMVARAYDPGCKVDTMPVLEADQGTGKSTFLKVLGHPWFAALKMAFGEKDFLQAIQGRWLVEIPDMAGFSRREHSDILATISDARDVYRKTYARVTEEHPRVTVFAATSENNEYLQETRGRRRYWPLVCGTINTDTLQAQRAQIFAEAVIEYRNGSQWHEVPENESDEIQSARASRDIWTDTVMHYAEHYGESKLTSCAILTNCINMELSRQDDAAKRRIYRIMTENGWKQLRDRKERFWRQATTAKG
jgi:5S rRNA maturation endonuclease (ribonuclease M5)